jgi:hypothetical protein
MQASDEMIHASLIGRDELVLCATVSGLSAHADPVAALRTAAPLRQHGPAGLAGRSVFKRSASCHIVGCALARAEPHAERRSA